jgi:GT2 family glycosyltransferase
LCLYSINKNSKFKHEIILHVNDGSDGTLDYVKNNNFIHTFSNKNIGLCKSINLAANLSTKNYLLYAHDDMYFCPGWDEALVDEVNKIDNDLYYLSGTMIEPNSGHIKFDCGKNIDEFDEIKLLNNYKNINLYDHQGTHFAPHLVSRNTWSKVGGFSEDFNFKSCSDPDFNMKLWLIGVRIFKGINKFKVYHFSSVTSRKKNNFKEIRGDKHFLYKWKITHKFFLKHYMKTKSKYLGPLDEPKKNLSYFIDLLICKIKLIFIF